MGLVLLVVFLLVFVALFSKDKIATMLYSGDTITAEFETDYKLRPDVSVVKVGYVEVGRVKSVERTDEGLARVEMKIDRDVLEVLGSSPSATIRSTTLLGGSYFVDLAAGGDPGAFEADAIPVDRTDVPVELDKVARALQPDALAGLQQTLALTDETFDADGQDALRRLMASAPGTLAPTASVLDAAQGNNPDDLTHLVTGLESAGRVLTANEGQLDEILTGLRSTTAVLSQHDDDVAAALSNLPTTLTHTNEALTALDGTLAVVRDVSDDLRDPVQELDDALTALEPVLADARPVVTDARVLLTDATPLVQDLVPTAGAADRVLGDLAGPVLDNLNGPVVDWLYTDYQGVDEYAMTTSDRPLYEETVFTFVNLNRASTMSDLNGHAVSFQPGIGSGSIGGLPISLEQVLKGLTSAGYTDTPINTLPPLTLPSGAPPTAPTAPAPALPADSALLSDIQNKLNGYLGGDQ